MTEEEFSRYYPVQPGDDRPRYAGATGIWVPVFLPHLFALFRHISLGEEHSLLDLGHGDGRVVFCAAHVFGANATGYDLAEQSGRIPHELETPKARLKHGDFWEADWGNYNVLFYYEASDHDEVAEKAKCELEEGSIVLFHEEFPPGLPVEEFSFEGATTWLYRL